MRLAYIRRMALMLPFALAVLVPNASFADGNIQKVNHIIVLMQENHSFDNYFGALAYAPGSPYHNGNGACARTDHACVDGLTCTVDGGGNVTCTNSNFDEDGSTVVAFHDSRRCVAPDLDHSWFGTHSELNYLNPNHGFHGLTDGFVRVNDLTEQIDGGVENATEDQTMNFYNQDEIPFYYDLAQKFSIDDRYFSAVLGPTFPNRSYLLAATSFGHLTTNDTFPPPGGYKPITGTIFDLLNANNISWGDYFQDAPQGGSFLPFSTTKVDPHFLPLPVFLQQAAGNLGGLPQVSFVDPNFGLTGKTNENDEHPPTDIQRGQAFVSQVLNTVRNGPFWKDSVIFIMYDEHGGSYDHVAPPGAVQGGLLTPDGIAPGQCADLSNPPASEQPGGGAECSVNPFSLNDTSVKDAELLCPLLALNPTGPYPAQCANFNQLGIRVPFMAVSPFSKPHYVSHTIGSHDSMLAFIERRFLTTPGQAPLHLTARDQHASPLEDLFDFNHSPSLNTVLTQAGPPTVDCTPTTPGPPGLP
jgi:phospholipase C